MPVPADVGRWRSVSWPRSPAPTDTDTHCSAGLGASAGFLGFISIFSFILWYYPVYNGWRRVNKRGAAILFYTYFIFCGCHIIWCLYMVIGAPCE